MSNNANVTIPGILRHARKLLQKKAEYNVISMSNNANVTIPGILWHARKLLQKKAEYTVISLSNKKAEYRNINE